MAPWTPADPVGPDYRLEPLEGVLELCLCDLLSVACSLYPVYQDFTLLDADLLQRGVIGGGAGNKE